MECVYGIVIGIFVCFNILFCIDVKDKNKIFVSLIFVSLMGMVYQKSSG